MKNNRKSMFCIVVIIGLILDQITKYLVFNNLKDGKIVSIIPGVLELLYTENRGAAFGILQGNMILFYIITAVVMIITLIVVWKMPAGKRYDALFWALTFIFAGAAGNLIDRVIRKYVVDFIYFKPINFPVFNVADIYVTCATLFLLFIIIFYYKDEDFSFIKFTKGSED